MPVDALIEGPDGTVLAVTRDHALYVSPITPMLSDLTTEQINRNRQFLDLAENAAGSVAMNVDGSVTPVAFEFKSGALVNKSITHLRFLLNANNLDLASGSNLRRFGPVTTPGLTNGIEFYLTQGGIRTDIPITPIKNTGDWLDTCDSQASYAAGIAVGVDLLVIKYEFATPVILRGESMDRVTVNIRDNLTGLVLFQCLAKGIYQSAGE